jgi:hypothetical protein
VQQVGLAAMVVCTAWKPLPAQVPCWTSHQPSTNMPAVASSMHTCNPAAQTGTSNLQEPATLPANQSVITNLQIFGKYIMLIISLRCWLQQAAGSRQAHCNYSSR